MDRTETTETPETDVIPAGFAQRIKGGLALVQTRFVSVEERAKAQWIDLPQQAKSALEQVIERIRKTLDLPSRAEVQSLVERIEALDAKLAAFEGANGAVVTPAAPAAEPADGPDKATNGKKAKKTTGKKPTSDRRSKIKDAAKRHKQTD